MNRRLYKSRTEQVVSGVAGGVAEYLDVDPSVVRVVWALLAIVTGGLFLVIYGVMWLVVPEAPNGSVSDAATAADPGAGAARPAPPAWGSAHPARPRSGGASWLFGLILIGLGGYFLAREYLPGFDLDRIWPLGLVALGLLLLIVAFRRRDA